ncbi:MAG: hypothetical protein LBH08_00440 [Puniceicoccales bacterium]|nr:hypothetical protein [Puniceicoccales bacterium]
MKTQYLIFLHFTALSFAYGKGNIIDPTQVEQFKPMRSTMIPKKSSPEASRP